MGLWVQSGLSLAISGIFAFLAILVASHTIISHLRFYKKPNLQRPTVRILLIVPIYGLGCFLSLLMPDKHILFDTTSGIMEAYVIYLFLTLVLAQCGGEASCVDYLSGCPPLAHPWPLCGMPRMILGSRFLRLCKQGTLQFVVVKPVMAFFSIICLFAGTYYSVWYQWILGMIYNISYTLALYALLLFYMATKDTLRPYNPVKKFFAVKSVVFMTYWQSLAVTLFPGVDLHDAALYNNFILCLEMLFFAILHRIAFPNDEFRTGAVPGASVLENAAEVLSVRDVVRDAIHNFFPAYTDYILTDQHVEGEEEEEAEPRTYRAKTFLAGNVTAPSLSIQDRVRRSSMERVEVVGEDRSLLGKEGSELDDEDTATEQTNGEALEPVSPVLNKPHIDSGGEDCEQLPVEGKAGERESSTRSRSGGSSSGGSTGPAASKACRKPSQETITVAIGEAISESSDEGKQSHLRSGRHNSVSKAGFFGLGKKRSNLID